MLTRFTAPFLLIQRNGQTIVFDDLQALACATRAARIKIADHHVMWITLRNHEISVHDAEWIVRDDAGRIVREADVDAVRYHRRPYGHWSRYTRYSATQAHAARLGLPIPGTGQRGSYGRYLRVPSCHRALRAHAAMLADDRNAVRPTGRIPRPPTHWDDIPRSDINHRTWKRHRKTQWMAND